MKTFLGVVLLVSLIFLINTCVQQGKDNVNPSSSGGTGNNGGGNGLGGDRPYPFSNIPGNNLFYTDGGRLFIPNVFRNELISQMGRCDTTSGFYVISGIFNEDTIASFSAYFKTKPTAARKFRITAFRDTALLDTTVYLLVTDATVTRKTWRGFKGYMNVDMGSTGPVVSFSQIKCENVANFSDTIWAFGRIGCK